MGKFLHVGESTPRGGAFWQKLGGHFGKLSFYKIQNQIRFDLAPETYSPVKPNQNTHLYQ